MASCPTRILPRFGNGGGGDFNRDRLIDSLDEAIIMESLESLVSGTFSDGDMTGDGFIGEDDAAEFSQVFNN